MLIVTSATLCFILLKPNSKFMNFSFDYRIVCYLELSVDFACASFLNFFDARQEQWFLS